MLVCGINGVRKSAYHHSTRVVWLKDNFRLTGAVHLVDILLPFGRNLSRKVRKCRTYISALQAQYTLSLFCFDIRLTKELARSGKMPRIFPPIAQLGTREQYPILFTLIKELGHYTILYPPIAQLGTREQYPILFTLIKELGHYTILYPPIAQPVEQLPFKEKVLGSIPSGRTRKKQCLRTVFSYESETERCILLSMQNTSESGSRMLSRLYAKRDNVLSNSRGRDGLVNAYERSA